MKLFNNGRSRPVFGKAARQPSPTRPPEGNGLADGDRTPGDVSAAVPKTLAFDAPAAASDQPFDHPVLKLARAC